MKARAWYLAGCGCFLLLVFSKYHPDVGFTELSGFGEFWDGTRVGALEDTPIFVKSDSGGYDGQFYAQIALDPTLNDPDLARAVPDLAYRARRILLPSVAHTLGWGRPAIVIQVFSLLNVAAWLLLARLLLHWAPAGGHCAFVRWFCCLFGMGSLESVRLSLTDLPALLLLATAIRILSSNPTSSVLRASAFGAALLTRETSAIALPVLIATPGETETGTRRLQAAYLCLAAVPAALWFAYVHWRFPGHLGWQGNFDWPCKGAVMAFLECLIEFARGNFDSRYLGRAAALVSFGIQIGYLYCRRDWRSPWWRLGAAYGLLFLFLGEYVWHGYWAVCRAALPMTVAYNLLLPSDRRFWPLVILGNLPILHALIRFI